MTATHSQNVAQVRTLLDAYASFAREFKLYHNFSDTAQFMLFARSCNAFRSAGILCSEGLFVDSYNAARVGLEAGWLALVLRRDDKLAREWLTSVPQESDFSDEGKAYKRTFAQIPWIRKQVSISAEEFEQRTNLYKLLSTKSHANAAAMFFSASTEANPNNILLYPPEQLDSEDHRRKYMAGILYCLQYILHDIQKQCAKSFGVNWEYDQQKLFNISGVAYPAPNNGMEVVAEKVNSMYQAMMILKFAQFQADGKL